MKTIKLVALSALVIAGAAQGAQQEALSPKETQRMAIKVMEGRMNLDNVPEAMRAVVEDAAKLLQAKRFNKGAKARKKQANRHK